MTTNRVTESASLDPLGLGDWMAMTCRHSGVFLYWERTTTRLREQPSTGILTGSPLQLIPQRIHVLPCISLWNALRMCQLLIAVLVAVVFAGIPSYPFFRGMSSRVPFSVVLDFSLFKDSILIES